MALPQGAGPQRSPILWVPFCFCDAESPITNFGASFLSVWSGVGFIFLGKPRPHSKRCDPSARQFLGFSGFPSIYARIFCRRNAKFDVGTQVGLYIGDSHASHPTRAEFQLLSNFVGSPVFMPLTQNDQIWHGSQYGEGRVFRRSAKPLHLHK